MTDLPDHIPAKENLSMMRSKIEDSDVLTQRAAQERSMISKWNREMLEDKYLRLYEENLVLKKHSWKQEDKIKKLATKLLRVVNDKKKANVNKGGFNISVETKIEDLLAQIRDLQYENEHLKNKLRVTRTQLIDQTAKKLPVPFRKVGSRIDTGITKSASPQPVDKITRNLKLSGPRPASPQRPSSPDQQLPRYGHSLLLEQREENKQLSGVIESLQEQLRMYEHEIELLNDQMHEQKIAFDEEILRVKQQYDSDLKENIKGDIDIIKLQRELKEKASQLTLFEKRYSDLEKDLSTAKTSHDKLLDELQRAQSQKQEEQSKVITLQHQLKEASLDKKILGQEQERIKALEDDLRINKEGYEKLVSRWELFDIGTFFKRSFSLPHQMRIASPVSMKPKYVEIGTNTINQSTKPHLNETTSDRSLTLDSLTTSSQSAPNWNYFLSKEKANQVKQDCHVCVDEDKTSRREKQPVDLRNVKKRYVFRRVNSWKQENEIRDKRKKKQTIWSVERKELLSPDGNKYPLLSVE